MHVLWNVTSFITRGCWCKHIFIQGVPDNVSTTGTSGIYKRYKKYEILKVKRPSFFAFVKKSNETFFSTAIYQYGCYFYS